MEEFNILVCDDDHSIEDAIEIHHEAGRLSCHQGV